VAAGASLVFKMKTGSMHMCWFTMPGAGACPHKVIHTRAKEEPHPSTTTGGARASPAHHEVMQAWRTVSESRQH